MSSSKNGATQTFWRKLSLGFSGGMPKRHMSLLYRRARWSSLRSSGATQVEPYSTLRIRRRGKRPKRLSAISAVSVSTIGRSVNDSAYSINEWRCDGGCGRRPHGGLYISLNGVRPMW